jgi:hypothetical protein
MKVYSYHWRDFNRKEHKETQRTEEILKILESLVSGKKRVKQRVLGGRER